MDQKAVKLDGTTYREYILGKEVTCRASQLGSNSVREGDVVIVFKDTVASNVSVAPPTRESQADYIGVEGRITRMENDGPSGVAIGLKKL